MSGDPYITLLDVRDLRRPPNAYQLLGLDDLESDLDVIERAAKARRSTLMSRRSTVSPMQWQRMMDELDQAIQTLTDSERKAEYDRKLEQDQHPSTNGMASGSGPSAGPPSPATALLGVQQATCMHCDAPNPAGRKFCGSCGRPFFEPCIVCKGQTLIGERFCGNCGVNLDEACEKRRGRAKIELLRARELRDEGRYREAVGTIQSLAEMESWRLADVVRQAKELQTEVDGLREHSGSRVEEDFRRAQRAMEERRWHDAAQSIERVPPLLRNKEHEELYKQAKETIEELDYLNREIRAGIKSDRMVGLLPKVERVLDLDPGNARMKKLADKLRRRHWHDVRQESLRVQQEARDKIRAFEYQKAYELLDAAPPEVVDEDVEQVQMQAKELAYLWGTLRHSPLADTTLMELGARLQKLSPGDPKLEAVLGQLRQRLQTKKVLCEAAPWAKPPEETAVGCPVKRLTTFGSIDIQEVASQPVFVDNASRFFTACGAALQGLGKAAVQTNLMPRTGKSLFGAFTRKARTGDAAWGIDVSGSGVKAVRLARDAKSDRVILTAFDLIEHETALGAVTSEAERRDLLADSLKRFAKRNSTKDEVVCLTLAGSLVLGRFFAIPPVEIKRVEDMMQYEARQQVPFPLEQLEWDYHVYYDMEDGAKQPREAFLLATKRHTVVQHLSLFEDCKIRTHYMQSDCVALYNFYRFAFGPKDSAREKSMPTVALFDLGADNSNFVVCSGDNVWFRSMPRGSDELSRALMRRFEVTFATAEQLKKRPAKAKRVSSLHDAWETVFRQFSQDIHDSMLAYESLKRNHPITTLYCCGGGFKALGLHRHLLGV